MISSRNLCIILTFLLCQLAYAQSQLPKIIPPSPSTQQFQKYQDYPVSHFTGIPQISIPIYNIDEGDLHLPISLNYHSSGTKPTDPNGFVGLGWSLIEGGMVSRVIVDEADEVAQRPSPFYTKDELNNMVQWARDFHLRQWDSYLDTEPDIFSYNFGQYQGKFVFKSDGTYSTILLPHKPMKITPKKSLGIQYFDSFNILSPDGISYDFSASEFPDGISQFYGATAWTLYRIRSAKDSNNVILIKTQPGSIEYDDRRLDTYTVDQNPNTSYVHRECFAGNGQPTLNKSPAEVLENWYSQKNVLYTHRSYAKTQPEEINFRSGRIKFIKDLLTGMLARIEVIDKSNTLQKSIELSYMKIQQRYILKRVAFFNAVHEFLYDYKLDYFQENGSIPNAYSAGIDYWGYFNGDVPSLNSGNMPIWTVSHPEANRASEVIGVANRQSSEWAMKTLVLEKIVLPTGGYSVFNYEANRYSGIIPNYGTSIVGGLRIKNIKTYSNQLAMPIVKTYDYSQSFMDFVPGKIEDYSYIRQGLVPDFQTNGYNTIWTAFNRFFVFSDPVFNSMPHSSPVVYPVVNEIVGTETENLGITRYEYDYQAPETVTYETNLGYSISGDVIKYKKFLKPFSNWKSGNLVDQITIKFVNGHQVMVSHLNKKFNYLAGESVHGFQVDRHVVYNYDGCSSPGATNPDDYLSTYGLNSAYNYGDYYINSDHKYLDSETNTIYDINGLNPINTTTKYIYSNLLHDQVTEKISYHSNGDSTLTVYKYPHDFTGDPVYSEMVNNRHIWNPVLEEKVYKKRPASNIFLSGSKTSYKDWGSAVIAPELVQTASAENQYESRIRYQSYDNKGNVRSISKESGPKEVYIFGYGGSYPIAKIANADFTTVESVLGGLTAVQLFRDKPHPSDSEIKAFLASLRTANSLKDAQVTSYTYAPLIGMTSMTDAKGLTTTYVYDSFHRLSQIKDSKGNIVSQYCYNYAGQQTNCSVVTPNWQNTMSALRCKQSSSSQNTGEQEQEQKDMNPASPTYNQTRWVVVATNLTACPLPQVNNCLSCYAPMYKCINNNCEQGIKVYINSEPSGMEWICYYHYEFSDGTWSDTMVETSPNKCTAGGVIE